MAAKLLGTNSNIIKRSYAEWMAHCEMVQSASVVNFNESASEQNQRKQRALRDFPLFVQTYFKHLVDCESADFQVKFANKVSSTNNKVFIAEWPREHAKSVTIDIFIALWLFAQNKLTGLVLVGKNNDDACNLLGDLQAELQYNELFAHDWGDQYKFGDWQVGDFTTKNGIRFKALGRGESPRGIRKGAKRPNVAIIDDIDDDEIVNNQRRVIKVVKWIFGALLFALKTTDWRILVAGNRIHAQSILAHIVGDVKPNSPKREDIYHSKVFAIDPKTGLSAWPQRYTLAEINSKMKAAGTMLAKREFFHENHVDGEIFKDSMLQWKPMPKNTWKGYQLIEGYFDPSFENSPTSDFKAARVWGLKLNGSDEELHCLKSFVRRTDVLDVFRWMSEQDDALPSGVSIVWHIEKQFFNRPMQDALFIHNKERKRAKLPMLFISTDNRKKEHKYTRIVRMEPMYQWRKVYFNLDEIHNSDMIEGNNQLKGIEPGYNTPDDSPDADEGAWHFLLKHVPDRRGKTAIGQRTNKNKAY